MSQKEQTIYSASWGTTERCLASKQFSEFWSFWNFESHTSSYLLVLSKKTFSLFLKNLSALYPTAKLPHWLLSRSPPLTQLILLRFPIILTHWLVSSHQVMCCTITKVTAFWGKNSSHIFNIPKEQKLKDCFDTVHASVPLLEVKKSSFVTGQLSYLRRNVYVHINHSLMLYFCSTLYAYEQDMYRLVWYDSMSISNTTIQRKE